MRLTHLTQQDKHTCTHKMTLLHPQHTVYTIQADRSVKSINRPKFPKFGNNSFGLSQIWLEAGWPSVTAYILHSAKQYSVAKEGFFSSGLKMGRPGHKSLECGWNCEP